MLGDRTDPHRFDGWKDMTEDQRSGHTIDVVQDLMRRVADMSKALVRVPRTDAQQFAMEQFNAVYTTLGNIKDDLLEEMLK